MSIELKNLRLLFTILAAVIVVPIVALFLISLLLRQLDTSTVTVKNNTETAYLIADMYASSDDGRTYLGNYSEVEPGEGVTFRSGGFMAMQCVIIDGVGGFYLDPSNETNARYASLLTSTAEKNLLGKEVTKISIDLSSILARSKANPCPYEEGEMVGKVQIFEGEVKQTLDDRDLDADGTTDVITLTTVDNGVMGLGAKVYVNTASATVPGTNPSGKMTVVDIDTVTPGLEIAVQDDGPSSDYTMTFYRYDGKYLYPLGTIPGDIDGLTFDGIGGLETTARGTVLDTWFYRDTYQLVNGALLRQEKDFYARLYDGEVKMRELVHLVASPTDNTIVGSLNAGDGATILGCDNKEWCKARSLGGVEGWFNVNVVDWYNAFEGLSFAD